MEVAPFRALTHSLRGISMIWSVAVEMEVAPFRALTQFFRLSFCHFSLS